MLNLPFLKVKHIHSHSSLLYIVIVKINEAISLTCTVDSHKTQFGLHQLTVFVLWCMSYPHGHSWDIFCQPTIALNSLIEECERLAFV